MRSILLSSSLLALTIIFSNRVAIADTTQTMPDPCTLLTQTDAAGVMGTTSRGPDRRLSFACMYSSSDNHTQIIIRHVSAVFFGALARMGAKPISGLGDAAYSYHNSIYVEKDNTIINIAIFAKPARKDLDQAELTLAQIVVSRM